MMTPEQIAAVQQYAENDFLGEVAMRANPITKLGLEPNTSTFMDIDGLDVRAFYRPSREHVQRVNPGANVPTDASTLPDGYTSLQNMFARGRDSKQPQFGQVVMMPDAVSNDSIYQHEYGHRGMDRLGKPLPHRDEEIMMHVSQLLQGNETQYNLQALRDYYGVEPGSAEYIQAVRNLTEMNSRANDMMGLSGMDPRPVSRDTHVEDAIAESMMRGTQ